MSSAYFVPFLALPVLIDRAGSYRTRAGETVYISVVSLRHDFGCKGVYGVGQVPDRWHKSGRLFAGQETRNDIVEAL